MHKTGYSEGACQKTDIAKKVAQIKSFGQAFSKACREWDGVPHVLLSFKKRRRGSKTVWWTILP